jgi:large subunit ribosomal protein L3
MAPGIFVRKIGMTHIFDENGTNIPVTLVQAEECQISQIKTSKTDGYNAIQVAYGQTKSSKLSKPILGHLEKAGLTSFRSFGEFAVSDPTQYNLADTIDLTSFEIGQTVKVTGNSIGKGFTGNQKRHNFSRGPMTHGSKNHRLPGSIGAGSTPSRVYPGKKMAGQLGFKTTTIDNSTILYIDNDEKILALKGSLPGKEKNILKLIKKV